MKKYKTRSTIGLGTGILAAMATPQIIDSANKKSNIRREFLKGLGSLTIGTLLTATLPNIIKLNVIKMQENVDNQDYTDIFASLAKLIDNNLIDENLARTALLLAKQRKANDDGFFDALGIAGSENLSIWGLSHLDTKENIEEIRKMVTDPEAVATNVIERQTAYLISQGKSVFTATQEVSDLIFNMAHLVPYKLALKDGDVYTQEIDKSGNNFFDERILEANPKKMTLKQIHRHIHKKAIDTYWKTDTKLRKAI